MGDGSDRGAESSGKLDPQVAQAAQTDDGDRIGSLNSMAAQRGINGRSCAKEGSGMRRIERIGNQKYKSPICRHAIGKAAIVAIACRCLLGANIRVPL